MNIPFRGFGKILKTKFKKHVLMGTVFAFAFVGTSPVHAGFEWVPPKDSGPVFSSPVMPAPQMPMPMSAPDTPPSPVQEFSAPVPLQGAPLSIISGPMPAQILPQALPAPIASPVRESYVPVMPAMAPVPVPVMTAPAPVTNTAPVIPAYGIRPSIVRSYADQLSGVVPAVPSVTTEPREIVHGFGADIPMVLVMSQVVPSDYAYSFDDSVNPGQKLSWNGGKPWDEILNDALAPIGLAAVVTDKIVWIKSHRPGPGHPIEHAKIEALPKYDISVVPNSEKKVIAPVKTEEISVMSAPVPLSAPAPLPMPEVVNNVPLPAPVSMPVLPNNIGRDPLGALNASNALSPRPVPLATAPVQAAPIMATPSAMSPTVSMPVAAPMPIATNAPDPLALRPASPVAAMPDIFFWSAQPGQSLRAVVENWAQMTGTKVLWDTQDDFILPVAIQTHGTFSKALTELLNVFQSAAIKPQGKYYPNNPDSSGPILVIQSLS